MLTASKNALFDDNFKLKLESPELSLEAWHAFLHERQIDVRVEKVEIGKNMMGYKKMGYKLTYTDPMYPNINPAIRTKSDFYLLQTMLGSRFNDAVVPKISKNEVDNLHLMELYIKELAGNPFFRMDVVFFDFINGKMKEYKQVKKNERKHSQGTLRWLQQVTEYQEFETPEVLLKSVKQDLEQLERVQRGMVKGFLENIKMLDNMQEASAKISSCLADYLAMEQTSENSITGSICGLPKERLKNNVSKLIEVNESHQKGLALAYDGRTYERLMIHPVFIEIKVLTALKKIIDYVAATKSEYERAKGAYDALAPDDSTKERSKLALSQKEIVYFKARRALGYEMEKFKTYRTINFQKFFQTYVKFNLRGAKQMTMEWSATGISLNQSEEQAFFAAEEFYKATQGEPIIGMRKRGMSVNASKKTKKKPGMTKVESLVVVYTYNPGMGSKYMKVTEGELLTGFETPTGDWQVTNARGQKGLVKAKCAKLNEGASSRRVDDDEDNNMGGLDAVDVGQILRKAEDEGNEDDWSDEENEVPTTIGLPRPQPPSFPNAPPGLGSSPPAKLPIANLVIPSGGLNRADFAKPTPPTAAVVAKPPAFNPPTTKPEVAAPFGLSQQPPTGPTLTAPPGNKLPTPQNNTAAPPVSERKTEVKAPVAPVTTPAKAPKNNPETPAATAGPPMGRPKLGGPGGPSFLADIKKGNAGAGLKKVPDAEKSKEIGGENTGAAVIPGGGSSNAPPSGGLFGELGAKLQKRKV